MKLLKYRVTDFRSVQDSGWIATDEITAFIGVNESGKTNLLLPLWKLKPANDGEIDLLSDAPRDRYNEIDNMDEKPVFIDAHFELSEALVSELAQMTESRPEDVRIASVSRRLDGEYLVSFPGASPVRTMSIDDMKDLLDNARIELSGLQHVSKAEEHRKTGMLEAISKAQELISENSSRSIDQEDVGAIEAAINVVDAEQSGPRSVVVPRYGQLIDAIKDMRAIVNVPHPNENRAACQRVLDAIPSFVYYSNYGNLDSEIYLPHVIHNMKRTDLGSKERGKARTLKVLFDFVRLKPEEILELGSSYSDRAGRPSEQEIQEGATRTKKREILLQSASAELSKKFREWWKQGNYRLRFHADGAHFRIWVSDDLRPEETELELRSTGLQWFLSFYLVFLVESTDTHTDAILLLDEPGLSLHPSAQEDLSLFFESLAESNQLLYTTHSPFMVDADHLDRVRSVFPDRNGKTVASPDLRASEEDPAQSKSIFAVQAALGLSVSSVMLQGCQPIIVEGQSDQTYLSAIKTYLIRKGHLTPKRELVFVSSGGVSGVSSLAAILSSKAASLPYVLLDSDRWVPGRRRTSEKRRIRTKKIKLLWSVI